jgi:beta-lactamase regulating signal transducer with metallopeptidase domain
MNFDTWTTWLATALIHFVWQGTLIALAAEAILAGARLKKPQTRYAVLVIALFTMVLAPVATLSVVQPETAVRYAPTPLIWPVLPSVTESEIAPKEEHPAAPMPVPQQVGDFSAKSELTSPNVSEGDDVSRMAAVGAGPSEAASNLPNEITSAITVAPWLVSAWLLGVVLLSARLLLGQWFLVRWRRQSAPAPAAWQQLLARLKRHCPGTNRVELRLFAGLRSPCAAGAWRPVIYFPAAWVTELPPEALEALLAHELAHIRRGDVWIVWCQRLTETWLFYHPAVWWLSTRISHERELCCDDLAVSLTGQPLQYAQGLEFAALACRQAERPLLALALGGSSMELLQRIRRILGVSTAPSVARPWLTGSAVMGLSLATATGVFLLPDGSGNSLTSALFAQERDEPREDRPERPDGPPPREREGRPPEARDGGPPRGPREGERPPGEGPRPPREGGPRPPMGEDGPRPPREGEPGPRPPFREDRPRPPHEIMEELMHMVRDLRHEVAGLRHEIRELHEMRHRDMERMHDATRQGPPREGDRRGPGPDRPDGFGGPDGPRPPAGRGEPGPDARGPRPEGRDGFRPEGRDAPRPDGRGGPRPEGRDAPREGGPRPEGPPRDGDRPESAEKPENK